MFLWFLFFEIVYLAILSVAIYRNIKSSNNDDAKGFLPFIRTHKEFTLSVLIAVVIFCGLFSYYGDIRPLIYLCLCGFIGFVGYIVTKAWQNDRKVLSCISLLLGVVTIYHGFVIYYICYDGLAMLIFTSFPMMLITIGAYRDRLLKSLWFGIPVIIMIILLTVITAYYYYYESQYRSYYQNDDNAAVAVDSTEYAADSIKCVADSVVTMMDDNSSSIQPTYTSDSYIDSTVSDTPNTKKVGERILFAALWYFPGNIVLRLIDPQGQIWYAKHNYDNYNHISESLNAIIGEYTVDAYCDEKSDTGGEVTILVYLYNEDDVCVDKIVKNVTINIEPGQTQTIRYVYN